MASLGKKFRSLKRTAWGTGALCFVLFFAADCLSAEETVPQFEGRKASWHGFDRYNFVIDETTHEIVPFDAPEKERDGLAEPPRGKRRCVVAIPKKFAPNRPWSWRGCYWNHEPQTEIELLRRGFAVAHITGPPNEDWEAWYDFLVGKYGFSPKPAFIGMSRGGEYSYTWSVRHPDKVSCIYADNPGTNAEVFPGLPKLAEQDIPILHIVGNLDPLLFKVSDVIVASYRVLGGRIHTLTKEGAGHHPHSLRNPAFIADFIEQSVNEQRPLPPDFVTERFTRISFYPDQARILKLDDNLVYYSGPGYEPVPDTPHYLFPPVSSQYEFSLSGVEGSVKVIVPNRTAEGTPWVFRAKVTAHTPFFRELLENGFHIVTGPVPYNGDGVRSADWEKVYKYLTGHGFSAKPVLTGSGGEAAEAFGWAILHPDQTAAVYADAPMLQHSFLLGKRIEGNLQPVIDAKIPVGYLNEMLIPREIFLWSDTAVIRRSSLNQQELTQEQVIPFLLRAVGQRGKNVGTDAE
ncbi:MAG: hypothetical protein LBQ54_08530 [Planctomycetaceae bacterium]|jgi:hypothetical protein|nr:hypothetical protein [Planctomycetaceae bacterium]